MSFLRNFVPSIRPPRRHASLSVIIITLNCAERLRVAMTSVAGVADGIVVVERRSRDHTEEVVKTFYNARYIQRQWPDDMADPNNYAIEQASCGWIFVLNSGEAIDPEFRNNVQRWIDSRWRTHYLFPRYWVTSANPPILNYHRPRPNIRWPLASRSTHSGVASPQIISDFDAAGPTGGAPGAKATQAAP